MRVLVVVAHPNPGSFTHAVCAAAVEGLATAGHETTVLDLCALGFAAAMSPAERRAYHGDTPIIDPMVREHADAVRASDALVFVYPTWWSTMPAVMKGWLERVMVPGVAFVFDASHRVRPGLRNVRRLVGITTYGSARRHVVLVNDNGRRTINRALRLSTGLRTRTTWLGMHGIDSSTADQRAAFLRRVTKAMAAL